MNRKCVIVGSNGYFTQVEVTVEDMEKYKTFIIGETGNGYIKIKFPKGYTHASKNGVLFAAGPTNPKFAEALQVSIDRQREWMEKVHSGEEIGEIRRKLDIKKRKK